MARNWAWKSDSLVLYCTKSGLFGMASPKNLNVAFTRAKRGVYEGKTWRLGWLNVAFSLREVADVTLAAVVNHEKIEKKGVLFCIVLGLQ